MADGGSRTKGQGSPFSPDGGGAASASPVAASPAGTPPARRKGGLLAPGPADETAKLLPPGKAGGAARSRGRTLLYSAGAVVLLMLAGMAASELNLRVSVTGESTEEQQADSLPPPGAAVPQPLESEAPDGDSASSAASGITSLLSSAATAVAQQLSSGAESLGFGGGSGSSGGTPKWQLRCAVVNNLMFHIDVAAGWAYAFQTAGCDVTLYIHERSLGIEGIMASWLKGRFRKPEGFPAEAGDYHIVVLPTFRDQHAELVQYLLQLPRLEKQRYFLTQHNPDWLLNHPNVDILQQQMLLPAMQAAHAAEREADPTAARKPLLRAQLVTLAPCVSAYTLGFLRQMALNLTEGQTYEERVGSFHVRTGGPGADEDEGQGSKDNLELHREWVEKAIDFEIPWMSPLVPWQPADQGAEAAGPARHQGGNRRLWAATDEADEEEAADDDADEEEAADDDADKEGDDSTSNQATAAPAADPAAAPPPAPPGAEATALLAELDAAAKGGHPRHVCIQGKLENSRRNYTAAFEAISHPAVLAHLRASGERLLLLGHRSKWETVDIPAAVADVVAVLESLPYQLYFDTLSRCRAIMLAFAADDYYTKKSSSTIATALNVGVPLVAERRTLEAYTFLQPGSCFIYDDRIPSLGGPSEPPKQQQQERKQQQKGQRRLLDASSGPARALRAADAKGAAACRKGGKEQKQQQRKAGAKRQDGGAPRDPPEGSYSAALLGALRSASSEAAREAVRGLKAEVMSHNAQVAAAFMAATEAQYTAEERAADAAAWAVRAAARAADAGDPGRVAFWGGGQPGARR